MKKLIYISIISFIIFGCNTYIECDGWYSREVELYFVVKKKNINDQPHDEDLPKTLTIYIEGTAIRKDDRIIKPGQLYKEVLVKGALKHSISLAGDYLMLPLNSLSDSTEYLFISGDNQVTDLKIKYNRKVVDCDNRNYISIENLQISYPNKDSVYIHNYDNYPNIYVEKESTYKNYQGRRAIVIYLPN